MEIKASFFETLGNDQVICCLCPFNCKLGPGETGICSCRYNKDGQLFTNNYAELVTLAVDPIEKKPLYHFYPGSKILSTGPNGCNFGCLHCQNWTISQKETKTISMAPELLAENAHQHNSIGIAFTYTEPLIWYEYLLDTAIELKKRNLKVVLVSNGYINQEPLKQLLPFVDAMNIDLKSIRDQFYKKICHGRLEPVLESIKLVADSNCHLELTNLLIPGLNDKQDEINELVDFIAGIDKNIPLHLSAYHPDYKLNQPSASQELMLRAFEVAQMRLNYVYLGNISTSEGQNSYCPNCKSCLIKRDWQHTEIIGLKDSRCLNCGIELNIIQ